jgi:hypothetical protein
MIAPASAGPLTPEHCRELTLANQRAAKIRRAAGTATFNGWATGIFAALSAPLALFSIDGFLVTVGLSVVAYNEFRGRKRLLQFDPRSTILLGWNQVGLMTLIVVYCLWMLYSSLTSVNPFAAQVAANPELAGSLNQFDQLYKGLAVTVYGTVIVVSVIFQGLNSLYYFSRRKYVEAYVQETPEWVIDLQRRMTSSTDFPQPSS